ncbi:heavy metal translocating P-type ATPase [Methyloterricola oryzae]|uniref:heavy metal translocating P-type ATPase n=1 Tax=Methyloterricola oryzae TaxID=1495050 RepID=UPI0009E5B4CB|nr:heavy metal translocating P-type ATPase [Methyloterricola oryzae]
MFHDVRHAYSARYDTARPPARAGTSDIVISFPSPGIIRVNSDALFSHTESADCRHFLERAFAVAQIAGATIHSGETPCADLKFDASRHRAKDILTDLAASLGGSAPVSETNAEAGSKNRLPAVAPAATAQDRHGLVHYHRYGHVVTGFQIVAERTGFLRAKNPVLYRKSGLCQSIERELMSVLGVDRYKTHSLRCTVEVEFDPRRLTRQQVLEILDSALAAAEHQAELDKLDLDLAICTGSLALAGVAQFAAPALVPAAAAVFAYTTIPSFVGAYEVVFKEKRLGVDLLDSIVVLGCLGTLQIFPGAVLAWCLSFGRSLVKKTEDNSKKMLLSAFGKQPRFVWLLKEGVEIEVSLDRVNAGDIVVAHTGDMVPVDGHITEGMAMIDQQALTGESTPAEKGVGDRVYASTIMVAGKIYISVEKAGSETASAKISQILNDTAGYKLTSQNKGERLADTAVVPTLAAGALAYSLLGPHAGVAVLNSDLGTGIRMAAPLAMLSTLALCAQKGILVKDGRALELMGEIDTVLFDKTGTLTRERPEVGRIISSNGFKELDVLRYAATAEQKFHHPIALAILHKAEELGVELATTDETQYRIGYGISVGIDGHTVRVGSRRYMDMEGIAIPPAVEKALAAAHQEGNTMVMVGVDDKLGGALELQASVRPEVREIVEGLRARGIKHLAIISGDHEAPTKKLAEDLGMDRYFAQVLPADKADYVEKLQQEGRKVCFVGDGINDSIALKKANVSISLRGATSIATDTAQIVFMEQGLGKLCELRDIAHAMDRNVRNSWIMIVVPNVVCVAGVFLAGFGIGASVLTNNVAALGALANGVWPMRKVAQLEAERRHRLELELKQAGFGGEAQESDPAPLLPA